MNDNTSNIILLPRKDMDYPKTDDENQKKITLDYPTGADFGIETVREGLFGKGDIVLFSKTHGDKKITAIKTINGMELSIRSSDGTYFISGNRTIERKDAVIVGYYIGFIRNGHINI